MCAPFFDRMILRTSSFCWKTPCKIAMRKIDVCSAYVLLRVKTNNRKSQITLVIYLDRLMDLFRLTALYLRTSLDE